jgi:hypothetical protein
MQAGRRSPRTGRRRSPTRGAKRGGRRSWCGRSGGGWAGSSAGGRRVGGWCGGGFRIHWREEAVSLIVLSSRRRAVFLLQGGRQRLFLLDRGHPRHLVLILRHFLFGGSGLGGGGLRLLVAAQKEGREVLLVAREQVDLGEGLLPIGSEQGGERLLVRDLRKAGGDNQHQVSRRELESAQLGAKLLGQADDGGGLWVLGRHPAKYAVAAVVGEAGPGLGQVGQRSLNGQAAQAGAHLMLAQAAPIPVAEIVMGGADRLDQRASEG